MAKHYPKIESQFEYSTYILLTFSILILYTSVNVYEKHKPVKEIQLLTKLTNQFNSGNGKYIIATRKPEANILIKGFQRQLTYAINNKYGIELDWAMLQLKGEDYKALVLKDSTSQISKNATIKNAVLELGSSKRLYRIDQTRCFASKNLFDKSYSQSYFNVNGIEITKSNDSLNVLVKVLIGRKVGAIEEERALSYGESFDIICKCTTSIIELNAQNENAWMPSILPWIHRNYDLIGGKKLSEYNSAWEDKLLNEALSDEINVVGMSMKGHSLPLIYIIFTLSIFSYHLSILYKISSLAKNEHIYFEWAFMFDNPWSCILRISSWIIIPALCAVLGSIFISSQPLLMLLSVPMTLLGAFIVFRQQMVLKNFVQKSIM